MPLHNRSSEGHRVLHSFLPSGGRGQGKSYRLFVGAFPLFISVGVFPLFISAVPKQADNCQKFAFEAKNICQAFQTFGFSITSRKPI